MASPSPSAVQQGSSGASIITCRCCCNRPGSKSDCLQPSLRLVHIVALHLYPARPNHHSRFLAHLQLQLPRHRLRVALYTPHTRRHQRAAAPVVQVHGQRVAARATDSERYAGGLCLCGCCWCCCGGCGGGGGRCDGSEAEWRGGVVAVGEREAAVGGAEAPQPRIRKAGSDRGTRRGGNGWDRGALGRGGFSSEGAGVKMRCEKLCGTRRCEQVGGGSVETGAESERCHGRRRMYSHKVTGEADGGGRGGHPIDDPVQWDGGCCSAQECETGGRQQPHERPSCRLLVAAPSRCCAVRSPPSFEPPSPPPAGQTRRRLLGLKHSPQTLRDSPSPRLPRLTRLASAAR